MQKANANCMFYTRHFQYKSILHENKILNVCLDPTVKRLRTEPPNVFLQIIQNVSVCFPSLENGTRQTARYANAEGVAHQSNGPQPGGKVEIVGPELEAGQTVGRGGAARVQSERPPRHGNASPLETVLQTGRTRLQAKRCEPGMPDTPAALNRCFNAVSTPAVSVQGDLALLDSVLTGLFCSVRCPGDIILKSYDLAKALRGAEITLMGGFQSPMEKEFLDVLLWGRVIICPARGLGNMRIPKSWRAPLAEGRLLLLSFFDDNIRRPTAAITARRNACVAAVCDRILVAHAQQNGKTEALCKQALTSCKPVLTLDSPYNAHLVALGASHFSADGLTL